MSVLGSVLEPAAAEVLAAAALATGVLAAGATLLELDEELHAVTSSPAVANAATPTVARLVRRRRMFTKDLLSDSKA
jgi:hypothetical protein